jgi:DNA-binding phage protein
MTGSKALELLALAAKRREKADEERHQSTIELHKYTLAARGAGIGVTQIASTAGLSRQAVYEILGQQPS